MKIAFITERMILGFGVDLVVDNTAQGLSKLGHDVTVFAINIDGTFNDRGYKVKKIPCPLVWNPLKQELFALRALPFVKNLESEFDVFLIETFPFYFYPMFLSKPCIIVDHGVSSGVGMDWKTKVRLGYSLITKNLLHLPFADKIITVSDYLKKSLPFYLQSKTDFIHNGVDHYLVKKNVDLDSSKLRKSLGIKNDEKLLLYVGRLNHDKQPYKGVNDLLEIYKKVHKKNRKIKLLMVGFGDENDKKNLESKGIKVVVKAPVEMMPVIFNAADVYVTASKWEGFDLPLIEANSYKKPSVCYDIGPHKEVSLPGKSAFVLKSQEEFIKKVLDLCMNNDHYERMSVGAFENSKRFLWKDVVYKYEALIKEVVSKSDKTKKEIIKEDLVDIISLNYNGKSYLPALFDSIKKQTYKNIKLTVVDNGSFDKSVDLIEKEYPWVNLIRSKKNLFFPRGNNLAISNTNGEYIFLVNNDTVLDKNAIEEAIKTIKKDTSIAAVASKMLFYKNKSVIDSIGTVITPEGSPFNKGIGQFDIGQYDKEEDVFGACFGAVMLRRSYYKNTIGPLDNGYYGYFEDVDWCYRARGMGYRIVTSPKSIVYHDHSGSSRKLSYEWKYYLIHRNYLRTIFKNYGLKNTIKYGSKKILGLIKHAKDPPSTERRLTCIRILFNTIVYFPVILIKRFNVKVGRIKNITDEQIWSYSFGERPFFNGEKYEPEYSIENIKSSYYKKFINFYPNDNETERARKMYIRFNNLAVNYWFYTDLEREILLNIIEDDLKKDLDKNNSKIIIDKIKAIASAK